MSQEILREKISILKKEMKEYEDDPGNYEFEYMLLLHRKRKDFENEFIQGKALKHYQNTNEEISNFISKNTSKVAMAQNAKKRCWKYSKFNYSRCGVDIIEK